MTIINEDLHDNIFYDGSNVMNKSSVRSSSCSTIQPFNTNDDSIMPLPIHRSSSCSNESTSNHLNLSLSTSARDGSSISRRKSPLFVSSTESNATKSFFNSSSSLSASAALLSPRYRSKFQTATKSFNHALFQQQQRQDLFHNASPSQGNVITSASYHRRNNNVDDSNQIGSSRRSTPSPALQINDTTKDNVLLNTRRHPNHLPSMPNYENQAADPYIALTITSSCSEDEDNDKDDEDDDNNVDYRRRDIYENTTGSTVSTASLSTINDQASEIQQQEQSINDFTYPGYRNAPQGMLLRTVSRQTVSSPMTPIIMSSMTPESSNHSSMYNNNSNTIGVRNIESNHDSGMVSPRRIASVIEPSIEVINIQNVTSNQIPVIIGKKYDYIRFLRCLITNWTLTLAIVAWFTIGVISIVTTKILVQTWNVPPLILTTQQLILGSIVLRTVLNFRDKDGIQPWPWQRASANSIGDTSTYSTVNVVDASESTRASHESSQNNGTNNHQDNAINGQEDIEDEKEKIIQMISTRYSNTPYSDPTILVHIGATLGTMRRIFRENKNFIMAGIFFSMDFLFSNSAMRMSDASFVETVKASDPICTTTIALLYKVDKLGLAEGGSLALLVIGVLLSTIGNSKNHNPSSPTLGGEKLILLSHEQQQRILDASENNMDGLKGSILTALAVTTANLCFAFRAMNQKRYRFNTSETHQLDDVNLLCRMFQIGAVFLLLPSIILFGPLMIQTIAQSTWDYRNQYILLTIVNSLSYATYNLASTFVLSKLTVLHHSSLNCLRRMCAILATSIFFQVQMSFEAILGLITSCIGFGAFTYFRNRRLQKAAAGTFTSAATTPTSLSGSTLMSLGPTVKDSNV